jgi:hypothetical protein
MRFVHCLQHWLDGTGVRLQVREQAVRLYELLAAAGTSLLPRREKALRSYAAGPEAYRQ